MKLLTTISFLLILHSSFKAQCGPGQELLTVQIQPDFFADEISWKLFQNSVEISAGSQNNYSVCVDTSQCLIFVMNDSGDDGLCCQWGNGYYIVYLGIDQIGNGSIYQSSDTTFYNCPENNTIPESDGVTIPTAFSPDNIGNNVNNKFSIIIDETVEMLDFFIYDRWGELLFSSTTPYFSWDGTFRGKDCSSGIYAYQAVIIYTDGKKKIKTGNITLVR